MAGMQWWMPRVLGQNMLAYDGNKHRRLRQLVEKAFVKHNVESMRPRIKQIADDLVDQLPQIQKHDGHVDYLEHFACQLPLIVICELLGLPDADRPKFTRWFASISKVSFLAGFLKLLPGMWNIRQERYPVSSG
jgi:cytochrome P450